MKIKSSLVRPAVAAALCLLFLHVVQASTLDGDDNDDDDDGNDNDRMTYEGTTAATITTLSTRNVTITETRTAASAVVAQDMTTSSTGETYSLRGYCGQDAIEPVGLVLGTNYTAPAGTGDNNNMSLSSCLRMCSSVPGRARSTSSPWVDLSGGESCYCGTTLDAGAPRADAGECTIPCAGDAMEA